MPGSTRKTRDISSEEAESQSSGWREKRRAGKSITQKMLKMKGDPEMYMKTKDDPTICPTQMATFLPGWTQFYTNTHVFCRNRRLFCCSSSLSTTYAAPTALETTGKRTFNLQLT
jgi:hypothetical protein